MSNGHRTRLLGFSINRDASGVSVSVEGELDLVSAREFEDEIRAVLDGDPPKKLVLHLEALHFIDSTGLRVLWSIRQHAQDVSCRLVLRSPSDAVVRLLKLTGMHRVFSVE